ncbi:hypothetical protein J437_LFUL018776 [Ladona fulva]|nr:hypothetical protein J437_LFUL018776 [Ladona fulva]
MQTCFFGTLGVGTRNCLTALVVPWGRVVSLPSPADRYFSLTLTCCVWVDRFFRDTAVRHVIHNGYVDDPRNTDNAWMETIAVNFHQPSEESEDVLPPLKAGSDAAAAEWVDMCSEKKFYANHGELLQAVSLLRGAHCSASTTLSGDTQTSCVPKSCPNLAIQTLIGPASTPLGRDTQTACVQKNSPDLAVQKFIGPASTLLGGDTKTNGVQKNSPDLVVQTLIGPTSTPLGGDTQTDQPTDNR